jgi:hypothetical protein
VAWVERNQAVRVSRLNPAGTAWEQVVGGPSPINHEAGRAAASPRVTAIGGVPYIAWTEFDGKNNEARVSRLEPELLTTGTTPSDTGATLEVEVQTYGVPYTIGFEYGQDSGFGLGTAAQVAESPGTGPVTVSQPIEGLTPLGSYEWRPFATDLTRRTASGPTSRFTTLAPQATDTSPPETRIRRAPKGTTSRSRARIRFTSSETGSTFECKLDKRPFKPCRAPRTLKRLRTGRHRFAVRAIDAAGNVDPTPAARRWKVR